MPAAATGPTKGQKRLGVGIPMGNEWFDKFAKTGDLVIWVEAGSISYHLNSAPAKFDDYWTSMSGEGQCYLGAGRGSVTSEQGGVVLHLL